jgi:hypothetical protein
MSYAFVTSLCFVWEMMDRAASCEVALDNVYNTAQVIRSRNASIPNVNITCVSSDGRA